MIKATTSNGTYYLIDQDNSRAKRVPGPGRNAMALDNEWFYYKGMSGFNYYEGYAEGGIEVGKAIIFFPEFTGYRITTDVVRIEEL